VKKQQRIECRRNITSVSISKMSPDDRPRLLQSDSISVSMVYSVEGAGEGNRPLALDTAVTLEP